jgi:hypothetical protein
MEPAKRYWIIEPVYDETGRRVADRDRLEHVVSDLLGTLEQVGGVVRIVADRVKLGELPPEKPNGRPHPVAETVGFVVIWQAYSPVGDDSETEGLVDYGADLEEEEAEDLEPDQPPGTSVEPEAETDDDGFGVELPDEEPVKS